MPTRNSKFTYFKESGIKKHKPISWLKIINEIFDAFIELAKKHKNINFIIKAKKGEMESNYYIKKISNLNLKNLKYLNSGAGHELIKNSQVIIGMNSAAIVESIAAKRKIFIPFFSSYRKKLYEQYTLNCPRTLMVKNKQDLKINIEKLIKQKYLKFPVDIKNYEKILLEYFGDVKNSKKTITDFINK
jgi:UDP-N-acetylglucosamine 2-epimerase